MSMIAVTRFQYSLPPRNVTRLRQSLNASRWLAVAQNVDALRTARLQVRDSSSSARSRPVHVKILISNDDGYRAEGLRVLTEALAALAEVTVVAPDRNRSGASNSLTLDVPLRVFPFDTNRYVVVSGTPTDCVHLAISGLFEHEHDMVVSGINEGANLGDDVLYSGTVAAAIEGRFLGLSAIAVSLVTQPDSGQHYATAGADRCRAGDAHAAFAAAQATILNVNVPDLPYEALKGYKATRLGFRHRSEPIVRSEDPRGRPVYWVGPPGSGRMRARARISTRSRMAMCPSRRCRSI